MARAARMARPRKVVRRKALASYFRPSLSADTVGQRSRQQTVSADKVNVAFGLPAVSL